VAVPVDDPSLPSYTGTFTVWGGFNANGKTVNGTFTMTVHGTGSGGSSFKVHETDHFKHHAHGGGSSSSPAARTEPGKPRQLAPGVAGPLPIRYGVSLSGDGAWPHPLSGRVAIRASGFTRLAARPTAAAHRSGLSNAGVHARSRRLLGQLLDHQEAFQVTRARAAWPLRLGWKKSRALTWLALNW
jgi:hypothetical protein